MSLIGDFFNHEKATQQRFEQLDALNDIIAKRQEEAYQREDYLNELNAKIGEIVSLYPDIPKEEALKKHFSSLQEQNAELSSKIALKRKELSDLLADLQLIHDMEKLKKEKIVLQQELIDLQSQAGETYLPKDIIFAAYKTINGTNIIVNAFHYIGEAKTGDDDGALYQSLNGDRLIGFTKDFECCLYYEEGDPYFINAEAETFLSFSEVCLEIGSTIYLKKRVSAIEVNEILVEFNKQFGVFINDDDEYYFKRRKRNK